MSKTARNSRKKLWMSLFAGLILLFAVTAALTGFFLKRGVHCKSFHVATVTVNDFHLQWYDKLDLQIANITLEESQGQGGEPPKDLSVLDKGLRLCLFANKLFSRVVVDEIHYKDLLATLHLEQDESFFTLKSDDLAIRANFTVEKNILSVDITEASSKQFKSQLTGQIRLNTRDEHVQGAFTANLADSLFVKFDVTADSGQVSFQGSESSKITTITPFVDLFGLNADIQCWITEYLAGSRYHLKSFSGNFPLKDPLVLLDSFLAEVVVEGCEYTFAPGLKPIITEYTDVVFKKGVLEITPHNSTFYGQDGEKSWLDINFNDPDNIILTAYILTHAMANDDIMNLLKYYDIPLPFRQLSGKTDTDLTLAINLTQTVVNAHGRFLIDDGRVQYEENVYDVKDAIIILEGSNITLEQMSVSLKKLFAADISGTFNAGTGSGDIDIHLQKLEVNVGDSVLSLDEKEAKPVLHYHVRTEGSTVDADASAWKLDVIPLRIGAFHTPFVFEDFSGVLPVTAFSIPGKTSAKVSGSFALKKQQIDLKCELLEYSDKDLLLVEGGVPLKIKYDKYLMIQSEAESHWSINNIPLTIYPSEYKFDNNVLSVLHGRLKYGTFFDSSTSGSYDYLTQKGTILLENLHIMNDTVGSFLNPSDVVLVEIDGTEEELLLRVPDLGMEIGTGGKESWSVKIFDLSALYNHSAVLQKYMIDKGTLEIVSENKGASYSFIADIIYRYALIARDDKPVDTYHIVGKISGQTTEATINDDIHILFKDELRIRSKDISYNVPGIVKVLKEFSQSPSSASKKEKRIVAEVTAENSGLLLSPSRKISADLITLHLEDGKFIVHLEYGPGVISLEHEGTKFSLSGEDLDDAFMSALFASSNFHKGRMSVAVNGDFDDFIVVLKIEDTIMTEFTTLQNTLAMVDTIPALITFSLPSYNTMGLPVDSLVVGMTVKEGLGTFESLSLESPELGIVGSGWIDFRNDQIGMDLNLITQAKKNMSKIPLVGYIFVGKKKQPSITVTVSGKLSDPDVEHSTFKDVATIPFSMLYRTLALPAHLMSPMFESDEEGQDEHGEQEKEEKEDNTEDIREKGSRAQDVEEYQE